jgi:tetratricopeptide (TPR) repeat protein
MLVQIFAGDYRAAVEASRAGVAIARAAGLHFNLSACLHNRGDALVRLGDFDSAEAAFRESLDVAQRSSLDRMVRLNLLYLAYLEGMRGDMDALSKVRSFVEEARQVGWWTEVSEGLCLLGRLEARHGAPGDARRTLQQARELAVERGDPMCLADAEAALAILGSAP